MHDKNLGDSMKSLLFALMFLTCAIHAEAPAPITKLYGVHLFFNETEFVDELTLTTGPDGQLSGHMYVPNDFEGDITNAVQTEKSIAFDVLVPKNASRPLDVIFHYDLSFFDDSMTQAVGFVTIKDSPNFVASLVAFLRKSE